MAVVSAMSALLTAAQMSRAEPYRLRADAFAEAPSTAGFVAVQGEASEQGRLLLDAEALLWTGVFADTVSDPELRGEAVIASVRIADPDRHGEMRLGRMLYSGGAVRPLHLDGAVARLRLDGGTALEVFGGLPVRARSRGRSHDWVVGQRFSQALGDHGRLGMSYLHERDGGRRAREELGVEAAAFVFEGLTVGSTVAVDVLRLGVAEARVSATLHDGFDRLELFGVRRSPSRMLPATSLFAAIGAYDADSTGLTGSWRAAPRLDLVATATIDRLAEQVGATQLLRAELRLDDEGRGSLGLEGRRVSLPDAAWTGARTWLRLPIAGPLAASTELELAVPDEPRERGAVWPWGVVALRYAVGRSIEAALATEASASPTYAAELGTLLRVSGTWGEP
jgi:hypothetical protein